MYKVYGLIDPRYNKICYIGFTSNLLSARLSQHNNPTFNNQTPIAKLSRFLKRENKNLDIVLLAEFKTENDALNSEKEFIKFFESQKTILKNVGEGGEKNLILNNKSRKKVVNTWWVDNPKFVPKEILKNDLPSIYKMIKMFYTNQEIIKTLDLNCSISSMTAVRNGVSFKEEWKKHFKKPIPSFFKNGNDGISGRFKYLIVRLIDKGYDVEHISRKFPRIKGDLNRIRNKEIWKKVWVVYEQNKNATFIRDDN